MLWHNPSEMRRSKYHYYSLMYQIQRHIGQDQGISQLRLDKIVAIPLGHLFVIYELTIYSFLKSKDLMGHILLTSDL